MEEKMKHKHDPEGMTQSDALGPPNCLLWLVLT